MTPRQISAWQEIGQRRRMARQADLLLLLRMAQADTRTVQKFMRNLDEESQ